MGLKKKDEHKWELVTDWKRGGEDADVPEGEEENALATANERWAQHYRDLEEQYPDDYEENSMMYADFMALKPRANELGGREMISTQIGDFQVGKSALKLLYAVMKLGPDATKFKIASEADISRATVYRYLNNPEFLRLYEMATNAGFALKKMKIIKRIADAALDERLDDKGRPIATDRDRRLAAEVAQIIPSKLGGRDQVQVNINTGGEDASPVQVLIAQFRNRTGNAGKDD